MPMFIELLIEGQQTIYHGLTAQQHQLQLNQQAILIYKQAYQETKGYSSNAMLVVAINAWITEELAGVDWRNKYIYDDLIRAINAWQILPTEPVFEGCQMVRQALIELLPHVQKKNKLQQLCHEYKDYLKIDIETQLRRDHPQVYEHYAAHQRTIEAAPPGSGLMPLLIKKPGKNMERFIVTHPRGLADGNNRLNLAIQKYAAVSALQNTLLQNKPLPTQLSDFYWQFQEQRVVMTKNRDSLMIKFVKSVVTVLSIGIAAVAGIWGVKSKTLNKHLQRTLDKPTPLSPSIIRRASPHGG